MMSHHVMVSHAGEDQFRAEAAARRLAASIPTPRRRNPLAVLIAIVRASFEGPGPSLALGSIVPATH